MSPSLSPPFSLSLTPSLLLSLSLPLALSVLYLSSNASPCFRILSPFPSPCSAPPSPLSLYSLYPSIYVYPLLIFPFLSPPLSFPPSLQFYPSSLSFFFFFFFFLFLPPLPLSLPPCANLLSCCLRRVSAVAVGCCGVQQPPGGRGERGRGRERGRGG